MKYNRCGRSGLLLPAISLGLWQNFGGNADESRTGALLRAAFEAGITHFDLANNYGPPPGSAEERMGLALRCELAGRRDEIVISTKAGYHMWSGPYGAWGSRKHLLSSLDQSLLRLGVDYVDIFYHHRPDPETPLEETMGALADVVRQGKALYVGLSNYSPEGTAAAVDLLAGMGVRCLIHQPAYSMLNRQPEEGLLAELAARQIGCIAFSPLAQGRLTNRYLNGIPSDSRVTHSVVLNENNLTPEYFAAARELNDLAEKRGQTLAQMALAWVLRRPEVTSVLIGASRVEQLEDNIACLNSPTFSEIELERIDEILRSHLSESL